MATSKKKRGRPRKGTLIATRTGYKARLTHDVDGVAVRSQRVDLETKSRAAAKVKLSRLEKFGVPQKEKAIAFETFEEAAQRVIGRSRIASKDYRMGRLQNHVFPAFGHKPVNEVEPSDIRDVLQTLAEADYSRDFMSKVKVDIGAVLNALFEEGILKENPIARVLRLPEGGKVDNREKAVLTDEELGHYLAWEHPQAQHRHAVRERQTMACLSRIFGGARVGDIRAMRWEHFDTTGGEFKFGYALRKKTKRPQLLEIHPVLRPILRDWWERHGQPESGPVFPVLRGERAGEGERGRNNIAAAMRRDLMRAFGIEVLKQTAIERSDGKVNQRHFVWVESRPMTHRERELFLETEFTRPVDFHSFRRAFKQALVEADLDVQKTMALSGSTDVKAHFRYLNNTSRARALPDAAVPNIGTVVAKIQKPALTVEEGDGYLHAFPKDDGRITQRQSATFTRLHPDESEAVLAWFSEPAPNTRDGNPAGSADGGQNSQPKIETVDSLLLSLIAAAAHEGDTELVVQVTRLVESRRRRLSSPAVVDIDAARKGGTK